MTNVVVRLQLPLDETLDHSSGSEWVFLEDNLIFNDEGIWLDENLSRLQGNSQSRHTRQVLRYKPVSSSELDP